MHIKNAVQYFANSLLNCSDKKKLEQFRFFFSLQLKQQHICRALDMKKTLSYVLLSHVRKKQSSNMRSRYCNLRIQDVITKESKPKTA